MAKIGIFDSGAGGLSVLKEIIRILPDEEYVYFSDNAYCPYGRKPAEAIVGRCREITSLLLSRGCQIITVACNTATAASIGILREEFSPVKFIGMEPAIKSAALSTETGVVGVLATAGTLKASKYLNTKELVADGIRVVEHVGEGFVELVECGKADSPEALEVVRASVIPMLEEGVDRIVLGCTHYPFLSDAIRKVIDEFGGSRGHREVKIIDPAPAVARQLAKVMEQENIRTGNTSFRIELLASGSDELLKRLWKSIETEKQVMNSR